MIVAQPRPILWAYINNAIGTPWSEDLRCIGLVKGGCITAVAAYNAWAGRTCCFHGAIGDPAGIDRTFIRAIFEYPFVQCGLTHMFALVSVTNSKSLKFCYKSGFIEARRLSGAGLEGEDMVLLELQRENCRWIKERHNGQEISPASPGLHGGRPAASGGVERPQSTADLGQPSEFDYPVGQPDLERQVYH